MATQRRRGLLARLGLPAARARRPHRQPDAECARAHGVRFRLTRAGWLFLLVSLMIGLAAIKSQAALMFVLFGGMAGGLYVSALMGRASISNVELHRRTPARAWQYRPVPLGYTLRNGRRHSLGLEVEEIAPDGVESASGYCLHLPPRAVFRAGGRFAARRRGEVKFTTMELSTRFPFALVVASRRFEQPASLLIWPARGQLTRQLLHRGAVEVSTAPPSGVQGGQDEFFGLRDYRQDDNPRWIHWRRSAARQTPVVREMARPRPDVLWILVDTHTPTPSEQARRTRERLLRFAATLIDHALGRGYQVGLGLAYAKTKAVSSPRAGRAGRTDLLDALARAEENRSLPLAHVVEAIPPGRLSRSQVIVACPDPTALSPGILTELRRRAGDLQILGAGQIDVVFLDDPNVHRDERPDRTEAHD